MVIFAAVLKKVRMVDEHIGMEEERGNDVKWQKIKPKGWHAVALSPLIDLDPAASAFYYNFS